MTLGVLRGTLEANKNSLRRARLLTDKAATPVPLRVKLSKVYIPRRKDVLPEGMAEKDAEGAIKAEWVDWEPIKNDKLAADRVILYVHGGAYFICSRKTHRGITYRLAKYAKARLLAIDYRLAPEATFPVPMSDVLSAYLFLIDPPPHTGAPKYRPEQIIFMGDSAGGGLALSAILWLRDNGRQFPMPGAAALMSPWMDLTHSMPSWRLNNPYDYLPDGSNDPKYINPERSHYYVSHNSFLDHPLVSPLFAKENRSRPLPPMIIQCGDAEKLRDEIITFVEEKFPTSAIQLELYEDQVHVFQMFASLESISKLGLRRFGEWILNVTSQYAKERAPKVEHNVLRILNRKGHPVSVVKNPLGIVEEARRILIGRGQWSGDKKFGKPKLSRGESAFVVNPDYVQYDKEVAEELDKLAIAGGQVQSK
ncbi:hypothetical protein SpCBS45565_g05522 [Spizellomyces sp. 'palustris']|nr:hypothetical protein SpCBS45565_g05522 [Spizellomyces sp. 'palustris']